MATDLERLSVLIEANTKSYERAMLRIQTQTEKAIRASAQSVKQLNSAFSNASIAAGNFAKRLIAIETFRRAAGAVRNVIKELADLQDAADRIGIGTDRLQQLQFQAEQTGVSFETLVSGLDQFIKRLSQSRQGQGELAALFGAQRTPIDPKRFKNLNEALTTFIDLIGKGADEAARMQIAVAGFGKGSGDLALMFAGGAAEAKKFADQVADRIFTPKQLRAAQEYDDRLESIQRTMSVTSKGFIVDFIKEVNREFQDIGERGIVKFFQDPTGKGVTAAEDAGARVADAFNKGFENKDKALEKALLEKAKAGGNLIAKPATGETDFTILPPDPEKITEAKGKLRELLTTRKEHIKLIRDQRKEIDGLVSELERELSLIGKTNAEQRISNELHNAGAAATEADKQKITELVTAIDAQETAQQNLIDRMDELRDAAGGALDSFVQSIADSKGPLEAMKAALKDILQTIIQIAERALIARLFGAFGTAGGGLLAPALSVAGAGAGRSSAQAVNVHVTASPSPLLHLQISKSASAAEERAIARGPAVARNNSQRYAVP